MNEKQIKDGFVLFRGIWFVENRNFYKTIDAAERKVRHMQHAEVAKLEKRAKKIRLSIDKPIKIRQGL